MLWYIVVYTQIHLGIITWNCKGLSISSNGWFAFSPHIFHAKKTWMYELLLLIIFKKRKQPTPSCCDVTARCSWNIRMEHSDISHHIKQQKHLNADAHFAFG